MQQILTTAPRHYDINKVLINILNVGKKYIPNFSFDPQSLKVYTSLIMYFFYDEGFEKLTPNYNLNKGILIRGNVGVGKTLCLRVICDYLRLIGYKENYTIHCVADLVQDYFLHGEESLQKHENHSFKSGSNGFMDYNQPFTRCYDDLGMEPKEIIHFGNKRNLMADILLKRYDMFITHKMKTIVSTNYNPNEIEKHYGNRIRSRMREMFNDIVFEGDDKR